MLFTFAMISQTKSLKIFKAPVGWKFLKHKMKLPGLLEAALSHLSHLLGFIVGYLHWIIESRCNPELARCKIHTCFPHVWPLWVHRHQVRPLMSLLWRQRPNGAFSYNHKDILIFLSHFTTTVVLTSCIPDPQDALNPTIVYNRF